MNILWLCVNPLFYMYCASDVTFNICSTTPYQYCFSWQNCLVYVGDIGNFLMMKGVILCHLQFVDMRNNINSVEILARA